MGMRYIGKGAFCPPYPARDLTDEEVQEYGEATLLATKLYENEKAEAPKTPKPKKDGDQ